MFFKIRSERKIEKVVKLVRYVNRVFFLIVF